MYAILQREAGQVATQFLFNSRGKWIAFRSRPDDKFVFAPNGDWIGWLPWDEETVVDTKGKYLGTLFPNNRFYQLRMPRDRGRPGFPGAPGFPGRPGYPGFEGLAQLPVGTRDIPQEGRLVERSASPRGVTF